MGRLAGGLMGLMIVAGLALSVGASQDPAQDLEAYIAKPTPEHEVLKADVGVWEAEIKATMPGSTEPMVSKGQETNRLMGGLWLISDFRGEFGGQPFRGHGIQGYDPLKGKYVGSWVDSMTAQIMAMEGTYDAAKKTLEMVGESVDPMTKTKMKIRNVVVTNPDGTRTFTMSMEGPDTGGQSVQMMEILYKKVADLPAARKVQGKVLEKVKN